VTTKQKCLSIIVTKLNNCAHQFNFNLQNSTKMVVAHLNFNFNLDSFLWEVGKKLQPGL